MCAEGQAQPFTLVHCPSHHLFPFLTANSACGISHPYLLVASYLEILNARQSGFLKCFQIFCYGFLVYQAVHPLPYYPRAVFVFWIKEIMIQFALCKCICRISKKQSDNKSGIVKFHNIICFILFLQRYNIPTFHSSFFNQELLYHSHRLLKLMRLEAVAGTGDNMQAGSLVVLNGTA